MEPFSENHSKLLLGKEWLIKMGTDGQKSSPYLMKFYASTVDLQCVILTTDTKSMWAEVLSNNQFARRWRQCNHGDIYPLNDPEKEDEWRTGRMELLSQAHTLGAMVDITFELTETKYSDLAFELDCSTFKWRWEACFLGHKLSSDLVSTHLILPLISFSHLALSSTQPLGEMPDLDVEKAIDKVGRSARRTIDTHIRNAISRPRAATSLARISALFNFITELPPVRSTVESPDLQLPEEPSPSVPIRSPSPVPVRRRAPSPLVASKVSPASPVSSPPASTLKPTTAPDSATESEPEDDVAQSVTKSATFRPIPEKAVSPPSDLDEPATSRRPSKVAQSSGLESSPVRPTKKQKRPASSSDDDSEDEGKPKPPQKTSGATKRGGATRQPIKRGGKRF